MTTLRALSLIQPWGWCLLNGKNIENRTWRTKHEGPLLLHASLRNDPLYYANALAQMHAMGVARDGVILSTGAKIPPLAELPRGGIFGVAHVSGPPLRKVDAPTAPWHMPMQWGWRLKGARAHRFIPCRGMPGLFRVSNDDAARLELGWDS